MKQNMRFVLMVAFVLVVVVAVWWLLLRKEAEAPSGSEVAREETTDDARETPPPAPSAKPDESPRRLDLGAVGGRTAVETPGTVRQTRGGGSLFGMVLDEALNPVSGAEVAIQRTTSEQGDAVVDECVTVLTGAEGTFAAEGLEHGTFSLLATSGTLAATQYAHVRPYYPETTVMLQLRPAHSLAGRVVNPQGEPVAEAQVTVMQSPPDTLMRQRGRYAAPEDGSQALPLSAKTDEQGAFAFELVPANEVYVAACVEGYAPCLSPLTQLPAANVVVTLNAGSSIAGTVLQADTGAPVEGFALAIKGTTTIDTHEAATDASGNFVCAGLRPGEYALEAADNSWVSPGGTPRIRVAAGQQLQGIELRMVQGGTIRGRVYNEDTGASVPGASVILRENYMGFGSTINADANGAYELRGVPPGEHTLAIRVNDRVVSNPYSDYEVASVSMKAGEVLEGVDLPIFMGATVSGRVEYADGSPAGSAAVSVNPVSGQNRARVMAGADGTFVVSGPANGEQLRLQASKGTQVSAATETLQVPTTGGLEGVVLTLQEGGVIGGIVTNPSGTPLPGINVIVGSEGGEQLQPEYKFTDDAGRFLVAGLPAGLYTLTAMAANEQGGGDATAKVDLAAGQRTGDVRLIWDKDVPGVTGKGTLTMSGRVVDSDGQPLSDAHVYAVQSNTRNYVTTKSMMDGSFTLSGLVSGTYDINAMAGGGRSTEPVSAQAGATGITVTVSSQATASGRVMDAKTGKPLPTFALGIVAPGYLDKPDQQYVQWKRFTSPEGEFAASIPPHQSQRGGNLAVVVRADGYGPEEQVLGALSPGQKVEGLQIRMKQGARIEGVVQSSTGQAVAGASIYLGRYDEYRAPETRASSEGRFTMTNLPLSNVKLVAAHPAYGNGEASVTPRAGVTSQVTIELPAGGAVEGIVRMGGQPKAGAQVRLYMYEGGRQQASTVTDASGHYQFNNVAAGRGSVNTWLQSGRASLNQSRQVIVEAERTTTADFDLPTQTGGLEGFVTIGGQPVSRGQVSAYVSSEEGSISSYAQLNGDGSYRLESVPVGEVRASVYIYEASGGRGRQQEETVQIAADSVTRLDFELPLPTFVSGYLTGLREGEAGYIGLLPGEITIGTLTKEKVQEYMKMLAGQAQMEPDGTFRMSDVKPGKYTVVGVAADPNAQSPEEAILNARIVTEIIDVQEGEEITVNLSIK